MKYRVFIEKKALKQLEDIDTSTRKIIKEKIAKLKMDSLLILILKS
jgi:mRNA-degrading endonuclease RelE of RelBE toxin-antitoxin system